MRASRPLLLVRRQVLLDHHQVTRRDRRDQIRCGLVDRDPGGARRARCRGSWRRRTGTARGRRATRLCRPAVPRPRRSFAEPRRLLARAGRERDAAAAARPCSRTRPPLVIAHSRSSSRSRGTYRGRSWPSSRTVPTARFTRNASRDTSATFGSRSPSRWSARDRKTPRLSLLQHLRDGKRDPRERGEPTQRFDGLADGAASATSQSSQPSHSAARTAAGARTAEPRRTHRASLRV